MRRRFALLGLVFFVSITLLACAFAPVKRPDVNQYQDMFKQSGECNDDDGECLENVVAALESMGYEVLSANEKLGMVRTKPRMVITPDVCDCGTWNGVEINGSANSTLVVKLREASPNTAQIGISMECSTTFSGKNLYGVTTRQETYVCASRGVMENEFWATLERLNE